jgi:ubiquinone/menaquinone biosynthesis C-methylase UbiE
MDSRSFYNNIADEYDFRNSNPTTLLLRKKERGLIRRFARGRILDLGCGTGHHLKYLKNSIGSDVSEEMLKRVKPASWRPLIQCDMESIPFRDKTFETVLCMHSVLNIADPAKSVKEISRILKPGGLVILSVASIYDNNYSLKEKKALKPGPHPRKRFSISRKALSMRLFTDKELTGLFSRNRLDPIHFDSLFSTVKPRWNNFRDFTPREKLRLRLEKFSTKRYGCVYFFVFRKH